MRAAPMAEGSCLISYRIKGGDLLQGEMIYPTAVLIRIR